MNWFYRISRGDLTTNPEGLSDGGENLSGGLYNLMSKPPNKKRRKNNNVYKKKYNPLEHPGKPFQR